MKPKASPAEKKERIEEGDRPAKRSEEPRENVVPVQRAARRMPSPKR